jgi:hypothetical protein
MVSKTSSFGNLSERYCLIFLVYHLSMLCWRRGSAYWLEISLLVVVDVVKYYHELLLVMAIVVITVFK